MTKFTPSTEGRKTKSFEPDIIGIFLRGNPRIRHMNLSIQVYLPPTRYVEVKRLQVECA